ncbi:hypothetical protein ACEOS4_004803 [Escherichia coli]|uniref:hypothetical protein n=1 Tax=Escherichia coli TaxID=562 RepID=UPI0013DE3FC8|nr:hypothetical protein [Escherichia coli]EHY5882093.1 hypothetical protein [Escherichia coli]QIF16391.1 hypothetical protein G6Z99_26150 [Escherichia coli]HBP8896967.1 hypothetical protein [Escherichia coli]
MVRYYGFLSPAKRWHECGGAAESRIGEITSILRETEQKTITDTWYQSMQSI